MNKNILTIIAFLFLFTGLSSGNQLSRQADFYLLNAAPGDELYEIFGHSALRLIDDSTNTDIVFNYGLFSFTSENFIWCFMQGLTDYQLGVQRFDSFLYYYEKTKTSVWQQKLTISHSAKQKLFDALSENYREENRFYRYNYFTNNCATKLRDQIISNTGAPTQFKAYKTYTYRQLVNMHTQSWPWTRIGIGILLGRDANREATLEETMFLPMFLRDRFAEATLNDNRQLCEKTEVVIDGVQFQGETIRFSILSIPFTIILILTLLLIRNSSNTAPLFRASRVLWLFLTGIVGILVVFFWFFSIHPGLRPNINLLWSLPFNLIVAFFYARKTTATWLETYSRIASALVLVFLLLVLINIQTVPYEGIIASLITVALYNPERIKRFLRK